MKFVYKLLDRETGLFRRQGGGWSNVGKTWSSAGHLKQALSSEIDRAAHLAADEALPRLPWGHPEYNARGEARWALYKEEQAKGWRLLPQTWEVIKMPVEQGEVLSLEAFYSQTTKAPPGEGGA